MKNRDVLLFVVGVMVLGLTLWGIQASAQETGKAVDPVDQAAEVKALQAQVSQLQQAIQQLTAKQAPADPKTIRKASEQQTAAICASRGFRYEGVTVNPDNTIAVHCR